MGLEEELQHLFTSKKLTLSLAESCTGGEVSSRLVKIPDCSIYFLGGIVAYSNLAKSRLLGVPPSLIKEQGAVSESVAREMAIGAKRQFGTDVSAAITGVAGPSGGSPQKPVGMVCFSIASRETVAWTSLFQGNRKEIIEQSAKEILKKLLESISLL